LQTGSKSQGGTLGSRFVVIFEAGYEALVSSMQSETPALFFILDFCNIADPKFSFQAVWQGYGDALERRVYKRHLVSIEIIPATTTP
jgi:hypothetical protein